MVEEKQRGAQDLSEFKQKIQGEIMEKTKFYKDFPKKGVNFMDLFSISSNPPLFRKVIDAMKHVIEVEIGKPGEAFDVIVGLEARGFVVGPILALEWNLPFTGIRKKEKLPGDTVDLEYNLEYGTDSIQIQKDSIPLGSKVLLLDDLLATGGTLKCAEDLIQKAGLEKPVANAILFEISYLKGREKLSSPVVTLVTLND